MDQTQNNKKPKRTVEMGLKDLEEKGVSLTPEGLGPWAFSKMKTLKNCPLKFYLQYVLKAKPDGETPLSLVTEVGKAAHYILELSINGKSITDSYRIAKKKSVIDDKTITEEQWAEHIETVELNISKFMERLESLDRTTGIKRNLQELRIGCTRDWKPTGFFAEDVYYRGVIDLVIQLKNGDIIIVDHKYGAPAIMGIKNFRDQLDTYKVLFNNGIEKIAGAQSGIHFIKEGEVILGDYTDNETIETSGINTIQFLLEGHIDRLIEIGYFKHIAGNACKYCDYRVECKAGKYKQLSLDSKKWFEIKRID